MGKEQGFSFQRFKSYLQGISPGLNFNNISIDRVRCALGVINFNIQGSVVSKEAYRRVNVGNNSININKKKKRT